MLPVRRKGGVKSHREGRTLPRSIRTGVVGALLLLWTAPALAHVVLRSSAPAAGAELDSAPSQLRLTFSAAIEPDLAILTLIGPNGAVALGAPRGGPDSDRLLLAPVQGALTAGAYTVGWQIAGPDGHPVRGEFAFTIQRGAAGLGEVAGTSGAAEQSDPGQGAPSAAPRETAAGGAEFGSGSPLYVAVRWLTFAGLLVVIGAVSFALLLLPLLRRRNPSLPAEALALARARAASVGLVAGGVLCLAVLLRLFAQSAAMHNSRTALIGEMTGVMLTRTVWGWGWTLQAIATAVLLVALWKARRASAGAWVLAAAATVALAATPALSGHAAATSVLAVMADTLHVLSAGGWLGTLLLVLLVGLPVLLGATESRMSAAASLFNAFSPLALTFAGLLTISGVYAAWVHLPALSALWSSAYGRTLLLKLATLSIVFAAGAYNWLRARPALEEGGNVQPLKRSAMAELTMGALVLAVTAALVATPPPAEEEPTAAHAVTAPSATPGLEAPR